MSDKGAPVIYNHETFIGNMPEGRDLGAPIGGVGVMRVGRPNSAANIRVARQHFVERDAREFNSYEGGWLDRKTGVIYDELGSDPLFDPTPRTSADLFVQHGGTLVFLRSRGTTVDEVEAARAEAARRADDEAAKLAAFRAKQKQSVLRLSDLPAAKGR